MAGGRAGAGLASAPGQGGAGLSTARGQEYLVVGGQEDVGVGEGDGGEEQE